MRLIIALLAALLVLPVAFAQDAKPDEEKKVLTPDELADLQKDVGRRLAKIEEAMKRIAKLLESRNPDQAARLRMAWNRSKDDRNLERIKEIEDLLKEEYFTDAFEQQKELEAALSRLLDILLDRDAERKDLQEKIERLEDIQQKLEELIEEERDHFLKSEKFADPEKALQKAAAAKAKLADLIERESKLIDKTKNPDAHEDVEALRKRLDDLMKQQKDLREKRDAKAQEALAGKAADLAKDIGKLAQGLPDAMKGGALGRADPAGQAAGSTGRAGESMKNAAARMQGGGEFDQMQKDAEQDLREAQDALRRLQERFKGHDRKELAQKQERIKKDTERLQKELENLERGAPGTDSGSGDLSKAQGAMGKAQGELGKGKSQEAVPHEEDAKEELERAYKKLEKFEEELKRLLKLPDYDKLAKGQDDTTDKTEDLLKKMKQEGGDPSQGGEGEPTPGQGGVEGAKKAMQRASRNLRGRSAKSANRDQKEALERLEKAREELEEALRQLREEEQLMLLEALERRLARMLQKQTKIFKETLSLAIRIKEAAKASRKPPRAVVDKGAQLGGGESELSAAAEKVLDILREEGTTVVIPDVIEDMQRDLDVLSVRLKKLQAGEYTQQIQQDVMATLRELIEVIKDELERRQGGEPGDDAGEGDPQESLLPTSAELKMLKALQLRVNRRTNRFDRLLKKGDDERGHIAKKQSSVGTLTRTMADRLNREEDG